MTIVTQNIDDLHERAGSKSVIHMHGALLRALCAACGHRWDAPPEMSPDLPCPACAEKATRPDVVWFGEIPYAMDRIGALLARADMFVAIGTSGTVYPAAGFVAEAQAAGARTLEMSLEPSEVSGLFDEIHTGPAHPDRPGVGGGVPGLVPVWLALVVHKYGHAHLAGSFEGKHQLDLFAADQ